MGYFIEERFHLNGCGCLPILCIQCQTQLTAYPIWNTPYPAREYPNPYDYMNSFDQFNDEQLPSKEQLYSRLSEEDIALDDYKKAKQIWKHFDIQNMGEYHDLYLKTDVLLLTDVFENFRDMRLSYYGLDPVFLILYLIWHLMLCLSLLV